jgi:predicted DNA-binding protein
MILWYHNAMSLHAKALPVRLDLAMYHRLQLQAKAEGRSMNEVTRDALRAHFDARPIPRERLRALASEIVSEDATLLRALASA